MRLMVACRAIDNMAGGVERQAIALINEMKKRGHEVCLLTWDPRGSQAFYEIDSLVHWYQLGLGDPKKKAGIALRLKRMQKVRSIVSEFKPDVILAFQQGMFFSLRLYTVGMGIPVVASIRNALSILDYTNAGKKRQIFFGSLMFSNLITVQFESYKKAYPKFLQHKIVSIPNAIEPAKITKQERQTNEAECILLSVGRLSFQKNYDVLIEAFSCLSDNFPSWKLHIAGEGEEREYLEKIIRDIGQQDNVKLLGAVNDVESLYCRSELFCLPSLWEGFPNSLSEALACGLASVGFQGCEGVNQLIKPGHNGLLAANGNSKEESVENLTRELRSLMGNDNLRKTMGKEAIESIAPYHPEKVFDLWEKTMKEVVK